MLSKIVSAQKMHTITSFQMKSSNSKSSLMTEVRAWGPSDSEEGQLIGGGHKGTFQTGENILYFGFGSNDS